MDGSGPSIIVDRSFGIIPIRLIPGLPETTPLSKNTVQILLIHQKSLGPKTHWGFPKGHPDPQDTSLIHTALRELEEETGLCVSGVEILAFEKKEGREVVFTERYRNPVRKVGKEVRYWVGLLRGKDAKRELKVQDLEVVEAGWFTWDEGLRQITFEEGKQVLKQVGEVLGGEGGRKNGKEKEEKGRI